MLHSPSSARARDYRVDLAICIILSIQFISVELIQEQLLKVKNCIYYISDELKSFTLLYFICSIVLVSFLA